MQERTYGDLRVNVLETNEALGVFAAEAFAAAVQSELSTKEQIAVILATGNSQLSFIKAVAQRDDIDWSRIIVLHMDEYLGMGESHPASFRLWMQKNVVDTVHPLRFEGVRGDHVPASEEIARYEGLIRDLQPSICVMGIGENGHLAFNDPPAEFVTDDLVRIVQMDDVSRRQQVGEGHFRSLAETPTQAISLTIPALLAPEHVFVVVPEARKASAVKAALEGEVTPLCPASILTTQPHARLFLDQDSAAALATISS